MQLMAEDDITASSPHDQDQDQDQAEASRLAAGLDSDDIRSNVYEGGFKTWECSIDLAKLLLDRGPRKDIDDLARVDHVIEVLLTSPACLHDYHNVSPVPPWWW